MNIGGMKKRRCVAAGTIALVFALLTPVQVKTEGIADAIAQLTALQLQATGVYELDNQINFNVLDQVEYDPQAGKVILIGHSDPRYATPNIPYLQYLAALLDSPNPAFSLKWTLDSERRVAELRRRLDSDDEWRKLAAEWGRWIDDSERVTPAGRVFLPMFGIKPPANTTGDPWQRMDRYQLLAGIFEVTGRKQPAKIVDAFGQMYRAQPNVTVEHLKILFDAAGILDVFNRAVAAANEGRITAREAQLMIYRALFRSFDQAFNFPGQATTRAFENAIRRGATPDAAMESALAECDRQLRPILRAALTELLRSKSEIQVPVTLVNPSLRNTLIVEPQYYLDQKSLLAKLIFEADYAAKKLVNSPELADKVPGYQTHFTFRQNHPGASRPGASRTSTSRLWISIDRIEASQSPDGNALRLDEAKMRINIREVGPNDQDLPNQQPGEYEKLLTALYDDFARHFSPLFHELREAAKLAYVAQWLKARNAALAMPAAGRVVWSGPRTAPGIIFVVWSPQPSRRDVLTVSAIGGISLRSPPVRNIPKNSRITRAIDLIGDDDVVHRERPVAPGPGNYPRWIGVIRLAPPGTCVDEKGRPSSRYEELKRRYKLACQDRRHCNPEDKTPDNPADPASVALAIRLAADARDLVERINGRDQDTHDAACVDADGRMARRLACFRGRKEMTDICFGGNADAGHQREMNKAQRQSADCRALMVLARCAQGGSRP